MMFRKVKVGEFYLLKNGKVIKINETSKGNYAKILNEPKSYDIKQNGTPLSEIMGLLGYKIVKEITEKENPEYFL